MRYRFIFALAFVSLAPLQPSTGYAPATVPPELSADLNEVSTALATVLHAYYIDLCNAISGYPTEEAARRGDMQNGEVGHTCAMFEESREPASRPLFAEPRKSLSAWVAAIQSGQDPYPPLREIRASMANWRTHFGKLLDEIHEERGLQLEVASLQKREKTLKKTSSDWPLIQHRISDLREKIDGLAEGQELDSHFSIPRPFSSADSTGSPFDGPVTPGIPDRLWIWLSKRSTIINHSVDAQIGLGNKDGPNVVADRDYPLTIKCTGCVFNNSNPTLKKGTRIVYSSVRLLSPKSSLTAQSPDVRPAVSQTVACRISEKLRIRTYQPQSQGPAGIPIPFQVLFVDANNDLATDGLNRKHFSLQLDGQGAVCADPHAGILRGDGEGGTCPDLPSQPGAGATGTNTLPADECEAYLVIDSRAVGNAVVTVQSLDQQSEGQMRFRFRYPWPRIDLYTLIPGAIAGFIANFYILRKRKLPWYWSLASSILGAFVLFVIDVWTFLDRVPVLPTWPFAVLLALLGGIFGVSAAKLALRVLTRDLDHIPEGELPSTGQSDQ